MCPWLVNEAHVTMIVSYRTLVIGEYDIRHYSGTLYQKNITPSVIFTWRHSPTPPGAVGTPVDIPTPGRPIEQKSSGIRKFDAHLLAVCAKVPLAYFSLLLPTTPPRDRTVGVCG
jgi:hypothetical protein